MIRFEKTNNMYIAYENGKSKYAFVARGRHIENFFLMADKMPNYIVLPRIRNDGFDLSNYDINKLNGAQKWVLERAISNEALVLDNKCFRGYKNITLVMPYVDNLVICNHCFDDNVKVNLALNRGLGFKQVHRRFSTTVDYEYEDWLEIMPKNIEGNFSYSDDYSIHNYTAKNNETTVQFTVENLKDRTQTNDIDK